MRKLATVTFALVALSAFPEPGIAQQNGEEKKPPTGVEAQQPKTGEKRVDKAFPTAHDATPARALNVCSKIKTNKDLSQAEDLQLTFELRPLTQNHLPMVRELKRAHKSLRDLADLDEDGWTKLINKKVKGKPVGFPPDTPGKDDTEKISNYAKALTRNFRDCAKSLTGKYRD